MSKLNHYIVETREFTESGDDYVEYDQAFDNKMDAIAYAKENRSTLYQILEYKNGRDYNPKSINI